MLTDVSVVHYAPCTVQDRCGPLTTEDINFHKPRTANLKEVRGMQVSRKSEPLQRHQAASGPSQFRSFLLVLTTPEIRFDARWQVETGPNRSLSAATWDGFVDARINTT